MITGVRLPPSLFHHRVFNCSSRIILKLNLERVPGPALTTQQDLDVLAIACLTELFLLLNDGELLTHTHTLEWKGH